MNTDLRHALLIAGPTAAGKSEVALQLAAQLGGEILTVDSMQVYRGLDLGTAKPTPAQRQHVPHHLIDVVEITAAFDTARFVQLAERALAEVRARGRVPILCGGTGLYFKALLEGLGKTPPADARLRAELEATPLAELLAELERRDPVTLARIDRHNPRRVVRALEVIRLTGQPFSAQRATWQRTPTPEAAATSVRLLGLRRVPEDLRARIDARTEAMFAAGLVPETRSLLARGLERNRAAMQAIGYRQVIEYLRKERSLPETIALVKRRTWQFARRQMTWFRHQLPTEWLTVSAGETPAAVAARVLRWSGLNRLNGG